MLCVNCGKEINDEYIFCHHCGEEKEALEETSDEEKGESIYIDFYKKPTEKQETWFPPKSERDIPKVPQESQERTFDKLAEERLRIEAQDEKNKSSRRVQSKKPSNQNIKNLAIWLYILGVTIAIGFIFFIYNPFS